MNIIICVFLSLIIFYFSCRQTKAHAQKMKETKIRNNKLRQKDGYIFPKSKPIIVNGKYYTSSNSASIDLKIDSETVRKRVLNPNPKFAEWKYA